MVTFGEKLRSERETRGISLEQIASATKISRRYLEALEGDDHGTLPGFVFTKGYVQAYAEFVGADAGVLVEAYRAEAARQESEAEAEGQAVLDEMSRLLERTDDGRSKTLGRVLWLGAGLTVVVAIVAGIVWMTLRGGPGPDSSVPEPIAERQRVAVPATVDTAPVDPEERVDATTPTGEPSDSIPIRVAHESVPTEPTEVIDPVPATAVEPPSVLSVPGSGVGTDVVNRELVGRSDRFEEGSKISFWTRVVGGKDGDVVRHVWINARTGELLVELPLGGSHWRTRSRRTLGPGSVGMWAVEARDVSGRVLARHEFECYRAEP